MTTVAIYEETFSGERKPLLTVEFPSEVVTARELIRRYVYETVREQNQREVQRVREIEMARQAFDGDERERLLNGVSRTATLEITARQIDWEEEEKRALESFQRNRFFLLVEDRQVTELEETILLRSETQISFLRLLPLAGG